MVGSHGLLHIPWQNIVDLLVGEIPLQKCIENLTIETVGIVLAHFEAGEMRRDRVGGGRIPEDLFDCNDAAWSGSLGELGFDGRIIDVVFAVRCASELGLRMDGQVVGLFNFDSR